MVTCRQVTAPDGIQWYRRMAAGGAGCVIVEALRIHQFGKAFTADALRPLAEAIRGEGAVAVVQLFLAPQPGRQTPADFSPAELDEVVTGFVRAATECRRAGFEGVEPHGAHGFLLNQFFSPARNTRRDEYGGDTPAGRMRLGLRIVEAVRAALDEEGLLFYRHTPQQGDDYPVADSVAFARRLEKAGLDVLDVSPASAAEPADLAAPFKEALTIPVIAVNSMSRHDRAVTALREHRADLVAIGRGLIADPDWPRKTREGRLDEIIACLECDEGCFGNLRRGEPVECVQH